MVRHILLFALLAGGCAWAQVYSPVVTKVGQADTSTLPNLVRDIYSEAKAVTPRQKAEAIWRFFLTDGRFAKPGVFYHIAGWTYEEPKGEVLDPLKLINSYGFGLCYHIAPLLEAVFEAGGFADARVWFLTGHTVAEVFYDGAYHYFDSDMLGYNNTDKGIVASVRQIEQDGRIITEQLRRSDQGKPWYPADVQENAIGGLAELFTTTKDNWVYPFQRYSSGHTMDFVLRPGERLIRSFYPAADRLFYLPFARQADGELSEFPREIEQYKIKTQHGPRSQKDSRLWGTGRLEYRLEALPADGVVDVASPYVIIGAAFEMRADVERGGALVAETSVDGGRSWIRAGTIDGPYAGSWRVTPGTLAKGAHGELSAVSGAYSYQLRVTRKAASVRDLLVATDIALNPRTLPVLTPGHNEIRVRTSNLVRQTLPVSLTDVVNTASVQNISHVVEGGQGYVRNVRIGAEGSVVIALPQQDLVGFDVGARFLDLSDGLAPDKYTAEVRQVKAWPAAKGKQSAAMDWATSPEGPWTNLWTYNPKIEWRDGQPIDRVLRWPEVDRSVRQRIPASKPAFVRLRVDGMAMDDLRLAVYRPASDSGAEFTVTHVWRENGVERRLTKQGSEAAYSVDIPEQTQVDNVAVILECPRPLKK